MVTSNPFACQRHQLQCCHCIAITAPLFRAVITPDTCRMCQPYLLSVYFSECRRRRRRSAARTSGPSTKPLACMYGAGAVAAGAATHQAAPGMCGLPGIPPAICIRRFNGGCFYDWRDAVSLSCTAGIRRPLPLVEFRQRCLSVSVVWAEHLCHQSACMTASQRRTKSTGAAS